jgi:hypothetical protein
MKSKRAAKVQEDWPPRRSPPAYVPRQRGTGMNHIGMVTSVYRIAYDFVTKIGDVYMEDWVCTDMRGTIKVFENIDPKVRRIRTWQGPRRDTEYVFEWNLFDGFWRAIPHGKAR